jgi:hypothetical protein
MSESDSLRRTQPPLAGVGPTASRPRGPTARSLRPCSPWLLASRMCILLRLVLRVQVALCEVLIRSVCALARRQHRQPAAAAAAAAHHLRLTPRSPRAQAPPYAAARRRRARRHGMQRDGRAREAEARRLRVRVERTCASALLLEPALVTLPALLQPQRVTRMCPRVRGRWLSVRRLDGHHGPTHGRGQHGLGGSALAVLQRVVRCCSMVCAAVRRVARALGVSCARLEDRSSSCCTSKSCCAGVSFLDVAIVAVAMTVAMVVVATTVVDLFEERLL